MECRWGSNQKVKHFKTKTMASFKFRTSLLPCVLLTVLGIGGLCSLVYGVRSLYKVSSSLDSDFRTKRSALRDQADSEFVFRRALHKVSWSSNSKVKSQSNEDIKNEQKDLSFKDVFVSVKTSKKFHQTRLKVILDTWFNLAPKQVRNPIHLI